MTESSSKTKPATQHGAQGFPCHEVAGCPVSRGERIRTSDLVDPNDARYRAALRPVTNKISIPQAPIITKFGRFQNLRFAGVGEMIHESARIHTNLFFSPQSRKGR